MLINVTVGMGLSIVAGVLVMWSIIVPSSPFFFHALLISFLLMGLVGSFWWRRQSAGGWPLGGIAITETLVLFLVLFTTLASHGERGEWSLGLLTTLMPNRSHGEWREWSLGLLGGYVVISPLIALGIYIGGRIGYLLLDRILVSRSPSSYRNVITGILVSVLLGVGSVLGLKFWGRDAGLGLMIPPVIGLLMGFAGSLWWRRERERWSLFLIVLIEIVLLLLVLIACGAMVIIGAVLTALAYAAIFIYAGARLGYWLRDPWPDGSERA